MVVPIGTKSPQKAKESLAEMMSIYKEDINLNFDSGELSVNGKPSMQFYKNYLFPSKNGESPEIETIGGDGPDLSDTEALKYFYDKLKEDSKIPFSRFDREGGATMSFSADGMDREEIRFFKFVTRLRSIFQEIMVKPLYIQMGLKYPELAEDELFKSLLSIQYNKDNLFEEMKQMDIMQKRVEFVTAMMGVMDKEPDDTGMMQDVPYFDPRFLIEKYMKISKTDLDRNDDMKADKKEEVEKAKKKAGGGEEGGGAVPGF
jgi:hypothetical protein